MRKKTISRIMIYCIFAVMLVLVLLPIYLVVSNSIKPTLLIQTETPTVIFKPTLSHYEKISTCAVEI